MMNIVGIFTGFNMLAGWLLYLVLNVLFSKKSNNNIWWTLGVIGSLLLASLIFDYLMAWSAGYLREHLLYDSESGILTSLYLAFEVLFAIILSLSLLKKRGKNSTLRRIQLLLIPLYLLGNISVYGVRSFDYATSVIPGGHMTIVAIGSLLGPIIWLGIIFILDRIIRIFIRRKVD